MYRNRCTIVFEARAVFTMDDDNENEIENRMIYAVSSRLKLLLANRKIFLINERATDV